MTPTPEGPGAAPERRRGTDRVNAGVPDADRHTDDLAAFCDAATSPFHAVERVAARLGAAGFTPVPEDRRWPNAPGRYLTVREGSLFAWSTEGAGDAASPFRVVGGHTDSPNLRIKPRPELARAGWDLLGVEVYGGPLLNSWLDRDLGLSGRVAVRAPQQQGGYAVRLFRVDVPLLRVAQLAVHLDRSVNEQGLRLNPQTHLAPIWGASGTAPSFAAWLGEQVGVAAGDVLAWDAMTHDLTPARRLGRTGDLLAAPRLDNLATAYAGTAALIGAVDGRAAGTGSGTHLPALVLFDHEEVGSTTNRGGFSQFLPAVLERVVATRGGDRDAFLRSMAASLVCSADMAHAVHPHYPERHEPEHHVAVNGGPVLKVNNRGRYASDAPGAAAFRLACEAAEVPMQVFVTRSDVPCGSTIGPLSAALSGAVTVDVGAPVLSMHSARELTGAQDPAMYVAALTAVLADNNGGPSDPTNRAPWP